jgi:hypothetical protein
MAVVDVRAAVSVGAFSAWGGGERDHAAAVDDDVARLVHAGQFGERASPELRCVRGGEGFDPSGQSVGHVERSGTSSWWMSINRTHHRVGTAASAITCGANRWSAALPGG